VRVVLVFDARPVAYEASSATGEPSIERAVAAARSAFVALAARNHEVGLATLGPRDCWLAPGRGDRHRRRVRERLAVDPALAPLPPDDDGGVYESVKRLRERLPADAQVLLFSPLTDDRAAAAAVRLDAHGHPTTVVSPDPTAEDTAGHLLAATRRRLRVADLRGRGVPVVDWRADADLERAAAETERRWER
jgi:uncharacterized protein (DUF58 family)